MKLLDQLSQCLDSSAARRTCMQKFMATGVMSSGSTAGHAADTLASLKELCASHGIKLGEIKDGEITCFVQEFNTKHEGYFCDTEYEELVTKLAKYAALKARRHPRSRWMLGMALSAASAVAVSAALPVATSTGLLAAAGPVGAAVGAVALSLDGRSMPKRDRRRAARHTPVKSKAAAAPAAAETSVAEQDSTERTAAAAEVPAAGETSVAEQDSTVLTAAAAAAETPAAAETSIAEQDSTVLTAAAEGPAAAETSVAEQDSTVLTAAAEAAAAAETSVAEQDSTVLTAAAAETPAVAETSAAEQDSTVLTAAAAAAAEVPAAAETSPAEQDSAILTAAPAGPAEEPLAPSSGSEELISALVEVGGAADSPAQAELKPMSLAAPAASAFAAAAAASEEPAVPVLPALVRCASPDTLGSIVEPAGSTEDSVPQPGTPGSDVDAAAFDGAVAAGLPPLALKAQGKDQKKPSGSKALKKGLSKSFKSVKKAFSLSSTGSSSVRSSLDIASPNASITTPSNARPPLPASGAAAFLRRSFSRDSRDVAALADKDANLLVQPSEGSATLRRMREALRRSFTVSTPRGGSRRASVDSAF